MSDWLLDDAVARHLNIAEALERERWPLYVVEVSPLEAVRLLRPGALVPGTVSVRPGTSPPAWDTARRLVEGDD